MARANITQYVGNTDLLHIKILTKMISRALGMWRSFRSSLEFHSDDERENSIADVSLEENSPHKGVRNNSADNAGNREPRELEGLSHNFTTIQPRDSIRTGDIVSRTGSSFHLKCVNPVNRIRNERSNMSDASEDDVVILNGIENEQNRHFEKNESFVIKKEFLHEDDKMTDPVVVNGDELFADDMEGESQSSYHTSPQEIFDLCDTEPKMYKMHKKDKVEKVAEKTCFAKMTGEGSTPEDGVLSPSVMENLDNPLSSCQDKSINLRRGKRIPHINEEEKVEPEKKCADSTIRLMLPISGTKKKKLFNVKISHLLSFVSNKKHPLHKWNDLITLENFNELSVIDKRKLLKILVEFLEVRPVPIKRVKKKRHG